jgi:hypothetical protein
MLDSITHYHKNSFQIDKSKPTMTATDGCSLFGNEKQLSKVSNKKKLIIHYVE